MATFVYPLSGQETSEAEYEALMSVLVGSGVLAQPGSTYLSCQVDGTDRVVYINEGAAILNGHYYQQSSFESVSLDVGSSQPRYDRVVLRLDASLNNLNAHVIKGTPGSSPAVPALTQSDTSPADLPLAIIYIPANAQVINQTNVTDDRIWFKRRVANNTNSVKTAPATDGDLAVNTETGQLEWYNNGTWQQLTPQIDASRIVSGTLDPARLPLQNINNLIDLPDGLGTYGNWSPIWNKTTETWDWDPNYRTGNTYHMPYSTSWHSTPAIYPSFTQVVDQAMWGTNPPSIAGQNTTVDVSMYFLIRAAQPVSNTLPAGYYVKIELFQNSVLVGTWTTFAKSIAQNGIWDIPITMQVSAIHRPTDDRTMRWRLSFAKSDSAGDSSARLAYAVGIWMNTFEPVAG